MLSGLSKRERNMIFTATVSIVLFVFIQFIFFPIIDKRKSLINQLHAKEKNLIEMEALEKRYNEIQGSIKAEKRLINQRDKTFTLFSFIDRLAQESNVKENIAYMKPSTRKSESENILISSVKVKVDGIVMKQAVDFLYKIESSDNLVKVSSLSISKIGEENLLSAIIETETIMPSEG